MNESLLSSSSTPSAVPKPDKIVPYPIAGGGSSSSTISGSHQAQGLLFLYGNPSSSQIALCCAGFADDHTVFQPFAKRLSQGDGSTAGGETVFVGVMCLPGYDDRPQDGGQPWTCHKRDGYTADEWAAAIREAAKVLKSESTSSCGRAKFTGIFHDWGVIAGTIWVNRAIHEAQDHPNVVKPDNVVYFDVLRPPSKNSKNIVQREVPGRSILQKACGLLYTVVLAKSFLLQRYVSKYLAAFHFVLGFSILNLLGLLPCQKFDTDSIGPLYKDHPISLFRLIYMAYPYWTNIYQAMLQKVLFGKTLPMQTDDTTRLHDDWNQTPILYMYGLQKNTMFHSNTSLQMLEQEPQRKGGSVSKAIGVQDAGHFLYVPLQKMDICVKAVLSFMAEAAATTQAN